MHIESEKATDLAGEMERGATLSHLCYWASWQDRLWCYITTLSLLRWMTRWNMMLYYRIERDVVSFTTWNVMFYHMERDVMLPHGTWCYVTTWKVMLCYHIERDVMLPHGTSCYVTTWSVMLCYHVERDVMLPHWFSLHLSHQSGGAVVPVLTFPVLWFRHQSGWQFSIILLFTRPNQSHAA